MKTLLAALVILATTFCARADVTVQSGTASSFVFTNSQDNAAWVPTAVVVSTPSPVSIVLTIFRDGDGVSALLASNTVTAASTVLWTPPADLTFPKGTALRVVSSNTGQFTVQLHRKPAP